MLATQRRHRILQELQASGTVRVADLAGVLGVSEMTVRRDIDTLDAEGQLLRVHGGATRTGTFSAIEPEFVSKSAQEAEAKRAIAAEALSLLRPDMTLLISGGTTTYEFARLLPRDLGLTVATNSIMVANALVPGPLSQGAHGGIRTLVLGGQRTPSEALVGPVTMHAMENLHADLCFMGVHGIDPEAGITSPNLLEAEVNAAMIAASGALVVLADASKYGVVGLAGIAPLSSIGMLITDSGITARGAGHAAADVLRHAVGVLRIAALPARSEQAQPFSHLPAGRTPQVTAHKGHDA
ncbi:DeoR/GlpR family DNA-binding transcription regulator [Arthrobacter sp. ISL-5]|uniref:DeoR/GlpR family DNA-binding transcription regulator n=1 Tax=Arthrobacter sp. ISL-5 TaxID=2819111 RepID=UPI001BED091D|nr:DeoR/GlpR family DNA-binding transcription regulator [Arthrobacter sp. ISL-5]MBT2555105.1 DeoR/GlpR transcriptional regulator [Arthrobacter sp. ISL-5]